MITLFANVLIALEKLSIPSSLPLSKNVTQELSQLITIIVITLIPLTIVAIYIVYNHFIKKPNDKNMIEIKIDSENE